MHKRGETARTVECHYSLKIIVFNSQRMKAALKSEPSLQVRTEANPAANQILRWQDSNM